MMLSKLLAFSLFLLPFAICSAAPYEIGEAMAEESFWKSDPVLFVSRHVDNGFQFTSDDRSGADSRREGGVTCWGLPVFESRVAFGAAGGIDRVELMLFATGGTETVQEFTDGEGRRFRRLVRVDKTIDRDGFARILDAVRSRLTKSGKPPAAVREKVEDASERHFLQVWPKGLPDRRVTLGWKYRQSGKRTETFEPGFVKLTVESAGVGEAKAGRRRSASGAKKIADNVVKDPRGDVFIDGVPMVDQGQKGYCSVASAERVLRYFSLTVDEHEIAEAAGTSAEEGTSTLAMKEAVKRIGARYKLGTVVCHGDFDKDVSERIAGLDKEVDAYNKAAKRLKKKPITPDMYVRHEGGMVTYYPSMVDAAMDAEVLREMKVNGMQKSRYTKFMRDVREQVAKGIPLFWAVKLGIYPEPGIPQTAGGHMRLIIGYNDKKNEILYSDSWGAGHELKRMPADWAWTISSCLMYLKPLTR